jgi:hypothetical protein
MTVKHHHGFGGGFVANGATSASASEGSFYLGHGLLRFVLFRWVKSPPNVLGDSRHSIFAPCAIGGECASWPTNPKLSHAKRKSNNNRMPCLNLKAPKAFAQV